MGVAYKIGGICNIDDSHDYPLLKVHIGRRNSDY